MDRALKERIIGAVVLVAIAVLVVPVFLDGPPTESGTVTEAVTLPGQDEQRRQQQTIVLERDRRQPVPTPGAAAASPAREAEGPGEPAPAGGPAADVQDASASAAAAASPPPDAASDPQAEQAEPAAPPQDEEEPVVAAAAPPPGTQSPPPAEPAASSTGMWAVQLGSFSNEQNAERLAGELRASGYAAFLSQLRTANGPLHRVRVGPQKDRESAETVAARLDGDGHKGQVVPHP